MPSFTFASFGAELRKLSRELESTEARRMEREAGKEAQKIARQAAAADLGGDPAFSGWGRLGTKLIQKRDATILAPASKLDAGRWTVAQKGRNVGETGAFLGPGSTRRGTAVRRRRDGTVARVRTSGGRRWNGVTRGKGTASDAWDRIEREIPKMLEKHVVTVIKRHFD